MYFDYFQSFKVNVYIFELQINSKYSEELAQESLEWIKVITEEDFSVSGDMDNLYEVLKDGTLLCRLALRMVSGHLAVPGMHMAVHVFLVLVLESSIHMN
jgi:hypothetical protein